jgi:surface antigen
MHIQRWIRTKLRQLLPVEAVLTVLLGGIAAGVVTAGPALADQSLCSGNAYSVCIKAGHTDHGYGEQSDWSTHRYWGAVPGHNCTNYAAYVESTVNGAPSPGNNLGDAGQWATNAAAKGIPVNSTPANGAVAQWNDSAGGASSSGHVAYVESVNSGGSITVSEDNYSSGPFDWRTISPGSKDWPSNFIHFKDLPGGGSGSSNTDNLSFVNLNYYAGQAQVVSYSASSNYTTLVQNTETGYPATTSPYIIPLYEPDGDLAFINMDYYAGQVQVVAYSAASNFTVLSQDTVTGYPATTSPYIIPLFKPNGDLCFLNMDYYAGQVQVVCYSASSNFTVLSQNTVTGYPDVTSTGVVIPRFEPDGDLAFINLQYYTGNTQLVAYSAASNFTMLSQNIVTAYPAVPTNGSIVPLFKSNGDLSFINLDYYAGKVQVVSYSDSSNYQTLVQNTETGYPATTSYSTIIPRYVP